MLQRGKKSVPALSLLCVQSAECTLKCPSESSKFLNVSVLRSVSQALTPSQPFVPSLWSDCSCCPQLRLSRPETSHPDKYLLSNFHLQTPLIDIPHQITSASYWTESHQNYIINMAPTSGLRTEKYLSQLWSYSIFSVVSFLMI